MGGGGGDGAVCVWKRERSSRTCHTLKYFKHTNNTQQTNLCTLKVVFID